MATQARRFKPFILTCAIASLVLHAQSGLAIGPSSAVEVEQQVLGSPRAADDPAVQPAAADETGWLRTAIALGGVLALIFGLHLVLRQAAKRRGGVSMLSGGRAPSGVLEVLGRFPVARGQSLMLLRLDRRILLLSQSAAGFRTLTEVTDDDEVASLVLKTRDEDGESNAARFNELLRQMERDPTVIAAERGEPRPLDGAGGGRLFTARGRGAA